jgi:hypothetical protein
MAENYDDGKNQERQADEQHPGAQGDKLRVPENPEQPRRDEPIGNGGVNQPAAFPPHN